MEPLPAAESDVARFFAAAAGNATHAASTRVIASVVIRMTVLLGFSTPQTSRTALCILRALVTLHHRYELACFGGPSSRRSMTSHRFGQWPRAGRSSSPAQRMRFGANVSSFPDATCVVDAKTKPRWHGWASRDHLANRSRLLPTWATFIEWPNLAIARFGWEEVGPRQRVGRGRRPRRKFGRDISAAPLPRTAFGSRPSPFRGRLPDNMACWSETQPL